MAYRTRNDSLWGLECVRVGAVNKILPFFVDVCNGQYRNVDKLTVDYECFAANAEHGYVMQIKYLLLFDL